MDFILSQDDAEQLLNSLAVAVAATEHTTDPETIEAREEWFQLSQRLSSGLFVARGTGSTNQQLH